MSYRAVVLAGQVQRRGIEQVALVDVAPALDELLHRGEVS